MRYLLLLSLLLIVFGGNGAQMQQIDRLIGSPAIQSGAEAPARLTTGGCCTQPFWSPDGKQVLYIDKPAGGKLGICGLAVGQAGAKPGFVSGNVEDSRIIGPYRVETTSSKTTLVRLSDGKKFNVPAQGRGVQFSPDFKRIAWSITNPDLPSEQQVAAIWVANVDGSSARRIGTLRRGGVGGWISNSALLVNGQDAKNRAESILWSLSVPEGKFTEIARAERLRSATLSPSGKWVAYYTTFNEGGGNGLWVASTSAGKPKAAPAGAFGAYQWRAAAGGEQLLIVPFKPDAQYHEFWQLNPESLSLTQLTRADTTPVKIANGDWRISPDGRFVAYVESKDRNIWTLQLP